MCKNDKENILTLEWLCLNITLIDLINHNKLFISQFSQIYSQMCKGEGGLPPFTFTAVPICIILTHRELEIWKPQLPVN